MSNYTFSGTYNDLCPAGLLLPIFPYEGSWNTAVRATVYGIGLLYCFLGVAIVADIFMGAIEKITSKTRKVYLASEKEDEQEVLEIRVWNDTVANLTLMALGSSAPEILLSAIEMMGNNFEAGDLGPGTIVGSAAFNLLIISAVCVVAIPNGETRPIKMFKVFIVTSLFSLFAYIWMLLVLVVISPNIVETWEAALTFLFFPLLVAVAYWADKGFKCRRDKKIVGDQQIELGVNGLTPAASHTGNHEGTTMEIMKMSPNTKSKGAGPIPPNSKCKADSMLKKQKNILLRNGEVNKEGLIDFYKELRQFPDLSDQDAATLAATKLIDSQPKSKLWYRIGACRGITGGRKIHPVLSDKLQTVYDTINAHPDVPDIGNVPKIVADHEPDKAVLEFHSASYAVPENIGEFKVSVVRHGRMNNTVRARVESFDGTAKHGSDYEPVKQVLVFGPQCKERQITIKIIDDNQWEPDEEFFLRLSLIDEVYERTDVVLGSLPIMEIVILNDDEPGLLSFKKRGLLVKESCGNAVIEVQRTDGADGNVSVSWRTHDSSATSPEDYQGGSGVLDFKHGETLRTIEIPIIDDLDAEKDECFEVELYNPTGGARLGRITRTAITISNDDDFDSMIQRMMTLTSSNFKSLQVHKETYKTQIRDALNVNGGNIEEATTSDYLLHFFTIFWKVVFACIPPPAYLGGWLCFITSLAAIGFLTAIIGDLAGIFGCLVGLKDSVTAITFVALGTSLPDLFASKTAATQEKYADNAIGNVNGSNSVNVFMGLGITWLIASIYHESQGGVFKVEGGTVGFSVLVYSACSGAALLIFILRRKMKVFGNAELGGNVALKWLTGIIFLILWVAYVVLSSLKAYDFL